MKIAIALLIVLCSGIAYSEARNTYWENSYTGAILHDGSGVRIGAYVRVPDGGYLAGCSLEMMLMHLDRPYETSDYYRTRSAAMRRVSLCAERF